MSEPRINLGPAEPVKPVTSLDGRPIIATQWDICCQTCGFHYMQDGRQCPVRCSSCGSGDLAMRAVWT